MPLAWFDALGVAEKERSLDITSTRPTESCPLLINQNRNRLAVARFRDEALKTPYRYALITGLRVAGDYDESEKPETRRI